VQINFALRELNLKLVYYGPGRSGKTTNLLKIHEKAPQASKGEMTSIATESDRTLFFDFLPLSLGKVAGMTTRFQLYTVPGQSYYHETRKLVLAHTDGVVWVADSQRDMMDANQESLDDLVLNLTENGFDIKTMPLVMQWNKRDMDDIVPVEELNSTFNKWNAPAFEAVAFEGKGVFQTLKKLAQMVIRKANQEYGNESDKSKDESTDAAPPTSPVEPEVPAPASPVAPTAPAPAAQSIPTPAVLTTPASTPALVNPPARDTPAETPAPEVTAPTNISPAPAPTPEPQAPPAPVAAPAAEKSRMRKAKFDF